MVAAEAAKHEIVSDLLQVNGSTTACFLAAAIAAFLGASTFLCSWLFGFWNSGETDRLRPISSISGPGINAFSWGRGYKGELKNKEREVFASFSSTLTPVVQVSSFGILAGRLLALCEREFWKGRYLPIISNDVRDAVVESPEYQFEAAAAFGTCRSQPEKLEAVVKTSSSSSRWSEVLRLRLSGEEVSWCHGYGCICHGWREDSGPLVLLGLFLVSRRTAP